MDVIKLLLWGLGILAGIFAALIAIAALNSVVVIIIFYIPYIFLLLSFGIAVSGTADPMVGNIAVILSILFCYIWHRYELIEKKPLKNIIDFLGDFSFFI